MGYDQGPVKKVRLVSFGICVALAASFCGHALAADKAKVKPATKEVVKEPVPVRNVAKEKKARVHTFSGLDVEGKLKTPQLLYFRSRVKQELDTSTSEKRSFLKELEATADDKGL